MRDFKFYFQLYLDHPSRRSRRVGDTVTGAGMERSRYSGNLRHFYCFDAFLCVAAAAYLQTTPVAGPESCSEDNLTQAFPGPGEGEMGREKE